jgi:polyisoprenoid-binding protein YceI
VTYGATGDLGMKTRILALICLWIGFSVLTAENARSAALEVALDPSKSSVQFSLGALLHTVRGTFNIKSGTVQFDPATGSSSGQIVVDVQSGKTGIGERDRQMHQNVLGSQQFPEASFLPDHITGKMSLEGDYQVVVHGILRIHGQNHDVTFPAKVKAYQGRIIVTASLPVPYVAWGMKDPSTFLLKVNKTVDLEIRLEGTLRQERS